MKRTLFILLLALATLCPSARARDRDVGGGKVIGDLDDGLLKKVDQVVDRGVQYLFRKQGKDGSWRGLWADNKPPDRYPVGETALALLALLRSGIDRYDERIGKGFDWLRTQPVKKNYEASVILMAVEARWAENTFAPPEKSKRLRAAKKKVKVPKSDLEWMKECVGFLLVNRVASQRYLNTDTQGALDYKDAWHYPPNQGADHSNTHFALLGLKSASRCKIPIPEEVWIHVLSHFPVVQEKHGHEVKRWKLTVDRRTGAATFAKKKVTDRARGWAYVASHFPKGHVDDKMYATTGSMTCNGIGSLCIALSELRLKCHKKLLALARTSIRDGMAWLDRNWAVDVNPRYPLRNWKYYYLWGLERVGALTWSRHMGNRDWYREIAEHLIENQQADGSWMQKGSHMPISSTSFALLTLSRTTAPGFYPF